MCLSHSKVLAQNQRSSMNKPTRNLIKTTRVGNIQPEQNLATEGPGAQWALIPQRGWGRVDVAGIMRPTSRHYKSAAVLTPAGILTGQELPTGLSSPPVSDRLSGHCLLPFTQENISTIGFCKVPGWHNSHKPVSSTPSQFLLLPRANESHY